MSKLKLTGCRGSDLSQAMAVNCLLWVMSRPDSLSAPCPLCPWKRTPLRAQTTSALGQQLTYAAVISDSAASGERRQSQFGPSCIWGYSVDGFRAGDDTWSARAAEARIRRARDSVAIAERRCRSLVPRAAPRTRPARDIAAIVVPRWPKLIRYPTQAP